MSKTVLIVLWYEIANTHTQIKVRYLSENTVTVRLQVVNSCDSLTINTHHIPMSPNNALNVSCLIFHS